MPGGGGEYLIPPSDRDAFVCPARRWDDSFPETNIGSHRLPIQVAVGGIRTRDTRIKSPLRYQLRHEARTTADPMTGPAGINIYV